ncbi:heavy-metal-associated domain-containing protein [Buchananella felis]|uniref:heavy-metal-associated domain-containing protein n=1 Tax=Buchananella felis TaxID=3231492 RepID=UPI003528C98E
MSTEPTTFDRTIEIDVDGMTCGHCVSHVTDELNLLPQVNNVSVLLRKDATSTVTVVISEPVEDAALNAAIDEAGYDVVAIRRDEK